MAETIKVAKSSLRDSYEAGQEVAKKALVRLDGQKPAFGLLFSTTGYDQKELLKGILDVTGKIPLSGCTGEGVITPEASDEGSTVVSLMLFAGDDLSIHNFLAKGLQKNSFKAAEKIVRQINKLPSNQKNTIFIFADSMTANTTDILKAFEQGLKMPALILGGTAGDMMKFKQTFQFNDDQVYEDALAVVVISGDYDIDFLVSHGCEEIGLEQTVTKSDSNSVVEIDGRPAWDAFREYLPGDPHDFKAEDAFHLCLGESHQLDAPCSEQLIIRMPVGLVKESGAVKFSVEISEGTKIRFTRRDPQVIAEKVIGEFKALLARNKGKKILAVFHFDCAGRGRVLYGTCFNKDVITPLQEIVGPDVPWIGFHTYGEIAPLCKKVFFHNFTAVIGVMFE